jgi:arsenate reductase
MTTLYGIPNCDSVKKAMAQLKVDGVEFAFHNYKTMGITEAKLKSWCKQVGWEVLLNTRGTTWRKIASEYDVKTLTETDAIQIMIEHPSCIKRPIVENGSKIKVGL